MYVFQGVINVPFAHTKLVTEIRSFQFFKGNVSNNSTGIQVFLIVTTPTPRWRR